MKANERAYAMCRSRVPARREEKRRYCLNFATLLSVKTLPPITKLLERAYLPIADEREWLAGILEGAQEAFDGHIACLAFTATVGGDEEIAFRSIVGDDSMAEAMLWMADYAQSTNPMILQTFFSRPVGSVRKMLAQYDREGVLSKVADSAADKRDSVAAQGLEVTGELCSVSWLHPTDRPLAPHVRKTLGRLASHLSAAYRLRRRAQTRHDAVIAEGGEVCGAEESVDDSGLHSLRHAALAIDRARRETGSNPDVAVGYWKALVEGRWTLVERFEADGRRLLFARPNAPPTLACHALDALEQQVVSLTVLGRSSKLIAYELGIHSSTVSRVMVNALGKLGVHSRSELCELYGVLVGHAESPR